MTKGVNICKNSSTNLHRLSVLKKQQNAYYIIENVAVMPA